MTNVSGPFIVAEFAHGAWDVYFSEELLPLISPSTPSPMSAAVPSERVTVKEVTALT